MNKAEKDIRAAMTAMWAKPSPALRAALRRAGYELVSADDVALAGRLSK